MRKIFNPVFASLNKIKYHILGVYIYVYCETAITMMNGGPRNLIPYFAFYSVDVIFFYINCLLIYPFSYKERKKIYKPIIAVFASLFFQTTLKVLITAIRKPELHLIEN